MNLPGISAPDRTSHSDVLVLGGGVIGLALALELRQRGREVTLLERDHAGRGASWAAAGMLGAVDSPKYPALQPLSDLSLQLYPAFIENVAYTAGVPVPFRTSHTLLVLEPGELLPAGATAVSREEARALVPQLSRNLASGRRLAWLAERSLDPRELCSSLHAACIAAGVQLLEDHPVLELSRTADAIVAETPSGNFVAPQAVIAAGAWSSGLAPLPVEPRKGHMLVLADTCRPPLSAVIRSHDVYLVPRGDQRILIGATVERSGFDAALDPAALRHLQTAAAALVPALARAPQLDAWVGFRPGTPDDLPILGPMLESGSLASGLFAATGHFRNGILLAPATARLLAQCLMGEPTSISIDNFLLSRFSGDSQAAACDNHSIATL